MADLRPNGFRDWVVGVVGALAATATVGGVVLYGNVRALAQQVDTNKQRQVEVHKEVKEVDQKVSEIRDIVIELRALAKQRDRASTTEESNR